MSLSPKAQRWARLVVAHDASCLTAVEFAARHGVNPKTLSWWRCRFRGSLTSRHFVPVELPVVATPAVSPTPTPLRVEWVDRGVSVAVPDGADLRWLRAVVEALS